MTSLCGGYLIHGCLRVFLVLVCLVLKSMHGKYTYRQFTSATLTVHQWLHQQQPICPKAQHQRRLYIQNTERGTDNQPEHSNNNIHNASNPRQILRLRPINPQTNPNSHPTAKRQRIPRARHPLRSPARRHPTRTRNTPERPRQEGNRPPSIRPGL